MRNKRFFAVATYLFILDQLTKILAVWFAPSGAWLYYVKNTGALFGWFSNANAILAAVSVVAIAAVSYVLYTSSDVIDLLGLSLVLAGISGNFVDRVLRGFVVDFLRVGSFPIFNIADVCIVSGVLVLLFADQLSFFRVRLESLQRDKSD